MSLTGGHGVEAFFATVCAAALLASLLVELVRKPRKSLALLALLRVSALILLLWTLSCLWRDSWREEVEPGRIALLRDVSLSMSMLNPSARSELSEMEAGARLFAQESPNVAFEEFVFASELRTPAEGAKCGPGATALGDAILELNRRFPGAQIILSSDGASNIGVHPLAAASMCAPYGTKVHTLIPDSMEAGVLCDLRISRPEPPPSWSFSEENLFRGVIERDGGPSGALGCRIELRIDGVKAAATTLSVDAPLTPFEIGLPKDARPSPGWHEFTLSLEGPSNEASSLNNSAPGIFKVPESDAVMLLWDRAGPELSSLKPVIEGRYSKLEFAYASEFAAKDAAAQRGALSTWALLIVGAVDPSTFRPGIVEGIAAKLKGGALSMVFLNPTCLNAWLAAPSIAPLLPVKSVGGALPSGPSRWLDFGEGRERVSLPVRMAWEIQPSRESAVKSYMLSGDGVLARRPAAISEGRVAAVAFLGSWRWRLDQDRQVAAAFQPFWEKFFESCGKPGGKGLSLSIEPKRDALSKGLYEFSLEDSSKAAPSSDAVLVMEGRDGAGASVKDFSKTGPRSFSCQLPLERPGVHWFHAELKGAPQTRSNRVPALVEDSGLELKISGGAAGRLKRLAAVSGGVSISAGDLKKFRTLLKTQPRKVYVKGNAAEGFGHEAALALLAAALLSVEWLLRRLEARNG